MKIKKYIRKGLLFALVGGFMLAGETLPAQAAEKVAVNASVFKDENVLREVERYDTNGDGYLDKSELASITELYVSEIVSDVSGLEKLTGTSSVILAYNGSSIKLGKNIKSVHLRMNTSSIAVNAPGAESVIVSSDITSDNEYALCHSVDVSKCGKLKDMRLFARGLMTFKLPENGGSIKEIRISDSSIKSLKIPTAKKLTYLSVFSNEEITSIDTRNAPNLETLYMTDNPKLKSLYLNKNKKLEKIVCAGTSLDKLDISENKQLEFLSCPYNKLKSLDCSKNVKLTAVQCYGNKLTSLNVKKSARIEEVSCANNQIKSLDLSQNRQLKTVLCYGNPLKSLFVKDKKNILKKVSIAPVIDFVKLDEQNNLLVKVKKNKKIKDYYVAAQPEGEIYYYKSYDTEPKDMTYKVNYLRDGEYRVQVASGVQVKNAMVYAKCVFYKDKVTVSSGW